MTSPVVPLERGYCSDSAERWANRTMSQPSQTNGVSYKIYIYLHECATHHSSRVLVSTARHPNIDSPSSYGPISLTSTVSKVMEKLVTNRLTYHLKKNKLLTNVQTGSRKGKITTNHITRLQDAINKYNNNKGYSVAVFKDFQSAYDMVWHTGLLCKLKKMGISGKMFTYIKNFLSNRTIQVRVGNTLSGIYAKNGTPQGSIISPYYFSWW